MRKTRTIRSAYLSLRALLALLLCATAACLMASGTLLAFFRAESQSKPSQRTLTFAERVVYQRAIEEVYWRLRIWPKENPNLKPPLDAVMSQAQLEEKVAHYLRMSQALEDYWQRPITAEQLQAEMERMAEHTKQPEVLRELFEALGNDPFVIAECLARPALAERFLTNWYAYDDRFHGELKRRAEDDLKAHPTIKQMKRTSGKYNQIELVRSDGGDIGQQRDASSVRLDGHEWDKIVQKLVAGFGVQRHVAAFESANVSVHSQDGVQAACESIPIGAVSALQEDETHYYATGVMEKAENRLRLATVSWLKEPLEPWLARVNTEAPKASREPSGGYVLPEISEGGCVDDSWTPIAGPPDVRDSHTAVWTGSEMIVWGGEIFQLSAHNTGGRYDPSTDSWTPTSTTDAPTPRALHTAVWTGTEMIVWGGRDENFPNPQTFNTGGRYNPITDSWLPTSITNAPDPRYLHTAVWTGSEMIVWGGTTTFFPSYFNTGGRYDPNTDSWIPTSTANAPDARYSHTAVWTGSEMVIWGGTDDTTVFNTGARYDPATNAWSATSIANAPTARNNHTAIWTGSEMVVWGGVNNGTLFNTGGKYNPGTDSWTATSTSNAPSARQSHTTIWPDNEMIVWGGSDAGGFSNNGGRYNPDTNTWTTTTTTNAPSARQAHTAIWTDSEMIVWGGYPDTDTGGRYNPDTDRWTATSTGGNAPLGRYRHTTVWTGSEMIIWGGARYLSWLNTGGRYNPSTDSWTATSITNAPAGRYDHTAIWTGNEMIVWGGTDINNIFNTGGRYDPVTDGWIATSTTNAPTARVGHATVWTGGEMIVWGGWDGSNVFDTGSRYNPSTDNWGVTTVTNAPAARFGHTAVWTGGEMIVWAGYGGLFNWLNTVGRYDPDTDTWIATNTTNAPTGRDGHTAVWTGNEMIVWGGRTANFTYLNTGGRYDAGTDTWTATTTTDAPTARAGQTAVWTGNEMIVWGGHDNYPFNTGGRYDTDMDTWKATSTTNAPSARQDHSAIWTGSEMIVWGGGFSNSGGRYCAQSGPTPTPSPTATPSSTPRHTPTPRPRPSPRPRP